MNDTQPLAAPAISLELSAGILANTRPWVLFISILWFVGIGLMLLIGVLGGAAALFSQTPEMALVMVIYPIMAAIYFLPALFLFRYAGRIRDFTASRDVSQLEQALDAQRAFWKFFAILTIVGFVVGLVMGLLAGIIGFLTAVR